MSQKPGYCHGQQYCCSRVTDRSDLWFQTISVKNIVSERIFGRLPAVKGNLGKRPTRADNSDLTYYPNSMNEIYRLGKNYLNCLITKLLRRFYLQNKLGSSKLKLGSFPELLVNELVHYKMKPYNKV